MELSIIIPVWNEASKIISDIISIAGFYEQQKKEVEILVVDDGSKDETPLKISQISTPPQIYFRYIHNNQHHGKGYAVKTGVAAARGEIIMFMDSGGTVPLSFIDKAVQMLVAKNAGFIIGSRHQKQSKIKRNLVWYRQITSFSFRKFIKFYFNFPSTITDTQCGFKVFKGPIAKELFNLSEIDGFLFDLEIILLAQKKNIPFFEIPIEWSCDRDSRLSLKHSSLPLFREMKALKKRFM